MGSNTTFPGGTGMFWVDGGSLGIPRAGTSPGVLGVSTLHHGADRGKPNRPGDPPLLVYIEICGWAPYTPNVLIGVCTCMGYYSAALNSADLYMLVVVRICGATFIVLLCCCPVKNQFLPHTHSHPQPGNSVCRGPPFAHPPHPAERAAPETERLGSQPGRKRGAGSTKRGGQRGQCGQCHAAPRWIRVAADCWKPEGPALSLEGADPAEGGRTQLDPVVTQSDPPQGLVSLVVLRCCC